MLFNFTSPFKTTNPFNQSTKIINHNSYANESLNLQCTLYAKNGKSPIQQLYENCLIYMTIINDKSYEYYLNVKDNKTDSCYFVQSILDLERQIFIFTNRVGNKCIILYKIPIFFIFELSKDDVAENKEEVFLEKLEILIISSHFKISIQEAMKVKKNGGNIIINFGYINELDILLENIFLKEIESKNQKVNSSLNNRFSLILNTKDSQNNDFLDKNEFMRNFHIYKEIYICKGIAFKYDKYTENVIPIEEKQNGSEFFLLKVNKIENNNYILVIEKDDKIFAFTKIENNTDISINEDYGTMTFISQNLFLKGETCAYTFSFKDKSLNEINVLKNLIIRCVYEKNNYVEDCFDDRVVSFFDCTNPDFDNDFIEDNFSFLSSKSKIIDVGHFSLIKNINSKENTKNKSILQTYKNHRTLVIKENNQIDIFKANSHDNELINITSISPIKIRKDNNNIQNIITNPKLFNKENEILFQDSMNKNKIYQFDLNKENIIQDWDCDTSKNVFNINNNLGINTMIDFTYPKKLGQLNHQNEMIGINSNNIFLLDGRVNRKNKIVDIKNYSINPNFKSVTTTGEGGISIGAENGDIRLFNGVGKNAKTLISGLNHPIRYLDSSIDGKYILATCDKYIMVINTENEYNYNGFNTCLGRIKINPLILKLSYNDLIKYKIENELFTPAKFNNNTNCNEMMIISSLGQYVILWNFKQVQNGNTDSYRIINANQFVIGNTTKYDKNQLIIALSDKLRLQNEKLVKD